MDGSCLSSMSVINGTQHCGGLACTVAYPARVNLPCPELKGLMMHRSLPTLQAAAFLVQDYVFQHTITGTIIGLKVHAFTGTQCQANTPQHTPVDYDLNGYPLARCSPDRAALTTVLCGPSLLHGRQCGCQQLISHH